MYIYENKKDFSREKPFVFHINIINEHGICVNWHENIELLYIARGKGRVVLDNIEYNIESPSVAVVNSSKLHNIIADDEIEAHCLIIDEDFLDSLNLSAKNILFESVIESNHIVESFKRIAKECEEEGEYYIPQVIAEVINIMVEMRKNHIASPNKAEATHASKKIDTVRKILDYLNAHYKERIDIEKIANQLGYSRYYITHLFKEAIGCPMIAYINELRCRHAKTLLEKGTHTVEEIANMYGFSEISYFAKTYKRYIGELPSKTKKQNSAKS